MTYFDYDVDVAEEQGDRSKIVEYGPGSVVIPWLARPYVSHGQAPEYVHYYQH